MNIFRRWIKQTKGIGIAAASIMLVLAMVASACAPVAAAPAEKVVKMGASIFLTGPLADTGVAAFNGLKDCARYINEQGGINGAKIVLEWQDNRGEIPRSIVAHKRLVGMGILLEMGGLLGEAEVLTRSHIRDQIPRFMLHGQSAITLTKDDQGLRWMFSLFASYRQEGWPPAAWLKENWTEERPPRIGALLYEHISALEGGEGLEMACKELGIEYVGAEVTPVLCIDSSTEWLRLAAKKPDLILVGNCGATLVVTVKDAKRLGITERGIKLVHVEHCFDDALHIVKGDANGWYVFRTFPSATRTDLPGMKILLEKAKEYRGWGPEKVEGSYVPGWLHMAVAVEAVRLALERVGYENLTGRAVRDGFANIKNCDAAGLMYPITLTNEHPWGCEQMQLYQIRDAKFHLVSDKWYPAPILLQVG